MEYQGVKKSNKSADSSLKSKTTRRAKIYDVFLCHHRSDQKNVELIAARLKDEAGLKPVLDEWQLEPGDPWQEEIETALNNSMACALFLVPSGLAPWQNEMMSAALEERIENSSLRVIPGLLDHAEPGEEARLRQFLQ